jgi:hypothetical protein
MVLVALVQDTVVCPIIVVSVQRPFTAYLGATS